MTVQDNRSFGHSSDPRASRPDTPVRIAVVDDSLVMRAVIRRLIEQSPHYAIAGELCDTRSLVRFLRSDSVDIIILDIEMPGQSGLDALPEILQLCGDARILVLSAHCRSGAPAVVQALTLGACGTLAKPDSKTLSSDFATQLLEKLDALRASKKFRASARADNVPAPKMPVSNATPHCLAIGSSTGGINALLEFLDCLGAHMSIPILLTQHLPEDFMACLAQQLDARTHYRVKVAESGEPITDKTIYLAPGNRHLGCRTMNGKYEIALLQHWDGTIYRPSVDPMLVMLGDCFGKHGTGMILSGMGNDGLAGSRYLTGKGGRVIAQDAQSSIVWGMPGCVVREGIASAVLNPRAMASHINSAPRVMQYG